MNVNHDLIIGHQMLKFVVTNIIRVELFCDSLDMAQYMQPIMRYIDCQMVHSRLEQKKKQFMFVFRFFINAKTKKYTR